MSDQAFDIQMLRMQLLALAVDLEQAGIGPLTLFDQTREAIKQLEKGRSRKSDARP